MYGDGGDDVDFSDDTWGSGPAAGVIGSKRGGGNFGGPGGKNFRGRGGGNIRSSRGNYGGGPGGFGNYRAPRDPSDDRGGFGNNRGGFGSNRGGFGSNRGGFGSKRGVAGRNWDDGGRDWDDGGQNWDDGDDGWGNDCRPGGNDYNRDRYSNAYGNYQGGYGPPRFTGPPAPLMGPVFGPPGPGFRGGPGGPGPMRPPNPIKFLTRCGVDMNIIQSWPKTVLRMCLPNHCGVCSMDCDNFSFARMHYTSKNHAKNIKKLMLDNNAGPTEDPLKSRELYCELCDVHITSKVHGDSHYAGKSHRSIVDGNKPPKNPKLLLPGGHTRRDRLIKREQKFLKQEPVNAPDATKAADVKRGEFYCEICKSSMSCSDQMTAHMNGKRHLSKEKQHILNVMKGQKEAKEKAAAQAAAGNDTDTAPIANNNGTANLAFAADNTATADTAPVANNVGSEVAASATEDESWVDGTGEGWDNDNHATGQSEAPLLFSRRN